MKNLILLLLLFPFWVNAQTSDTTFVTPSGDTVIENLRITRIILVKPKQSNPVPTPVDSTKPVNFTVEQLPTPNPDIVRAGAGANQFYGGNGYQTPLPTTTGFQTLDNDQRWHWSELQSAVNTYNWTPIDNAIKKCIDAGQKLSFGIMTADDGYSKSWPSFVPSVASNVPDWNSETYLSAWEAFLKALADHLRSGSYKNISLYTAIYRIDVRGLGNYGEFHYFFNPKTTYYATSASIIRIVNAHIKAFPDKPLTSIISAFRENSNIPIDAAAYLLTAHNDWGPIGIRSDHLGDNGNYLYDTKQNTRTYNGVVFQDQIMNRWKTSPMTGELMNDLNKITTGGNSPYWDLVNEVNGYHLGQFSNSNYCRVAGSSAALIASSDNNIRNASRACGYRVGVLNGTYTASAGQIMLSLTWINTGVTPVYENYIPWFELRSGTSVVYSAPITLNLRMLLPGTLISTNVYTGIPKGTYTAYVVVKENYRGVMPLAVKTNALFNITIN